MNYCLEFLVDPTDKMWVYIGIGFSVLVGVLVLFLMAKRLNKWRGRKIVANTKQSTKGAKDYKWTAISTNIPKRGSKMINGSEEEDSEDQEPINPIEKSKMMEAHPDSEESEED